MIELLDPRKVEKRHPELWEHLGWSYMLDYNWIIDHAFHWLKTKNVLDVGCGGSKLGPYIAKKLGASYTGIDRKNGIDFKDYQPKSEIHLILWASSLEHNTPEEMRALYLRSMDMLVPDGLFLANVTVSPETGWFEPSKNTNLSPYDILNVFDEDELIGSYTDIHVAYRADEMIRSKYRIRYGHWNDTDPAFIIAGVRKVKE